MVLAVRASLSAAVILLFAAGAAAALPETPKASGSKDAKTDPARSAELDPVAKLPPASHPQGVAERATSPSEVQRQFCLSNAAAANDARLAWQAAQLQELEGRLRQRIADLEAKRAEYVEWVRKRDEAMSKAADNVVTIYAKMKPDAAALQIAAMDDAMAAALLAKLAPRAASTILNEMEPGRAARLTNAMVGPTGSDRKKT